MNGFLRQFLGQLRTYSIKNKVPIITEKNAQFLHWLIRSRQCKNMLEIGCADAYSTLWFADAIVGDTGLTKSKIKNTAKESLSNQKLDYVHTQSSATLTAKIVSIEGSAHHFANAQKNIATAGFNHCIDLRFGQAQAILPTLTLNFFDFIFIDAQKKYYADFFTLCRPLLQKNGYMVFDDVIKFRYKMEDFYELINNQSEFNHQIIPIDEDDGIMLVWKNI